VTDESFETMLTGGHPNSLGRTLEVVDSVLNDKGKLENLYQCYFSSDEVVRLRTSNAMKRLWREHPDWVVPYIDRFLAEISAIKQASTQWTLAQLLEELSAHLNQQQIAQGKAIVKYNLEHWDDWIVINNSLRLLAAWAKDDPDLKKWLAPHLDRFAGDKRKSIASNAAKLKKQLNK